MSCKMDWTAFSLFVMAGCSVLLSVSGKEDKYNADDLVIKYKNSDVTDEVFISGTKNCTGFWHSFSKRDLPPGQWTDSVERPRSFDVKIFRTYYKNKTELYPGTIMSWTSPSSGTSRKFLKGFFVAIKGNHSKGRCRIYVINNTRFQDKELEFSFNLSVFAINKDTFDIRVYSLPPPKSEDKDNPDGFRFATVETKGKSYVGYPGDWTTSIAYKPSLVEGSIDVTFALPPAFWKLTHFRVSLLSQKCSGERGSKSKLVIIEKNTTDTQRSVLFDRLQNGVFSVAVEAVYNLSGSTDSCICRRKIGESFSCESKCDIIQTMWFDLSGKVYPKDRLGPPSKPEVCRSTPNPRSSTTSGAATETPNLDIMSSTNTSPPSLDTEPQSTNTSIVLTSPSSLDTETHNTTNIIIGVSVAAVVTLLILMLVLSLWCWRRRRGGRPEATLTDIKHRTVYLLATADHTESKNLIDRFKTFLKNHGKCDVIHPRDADLSQTSESVWITANIQKCDCIVVMYSKKAHELLEKFIIGSMISDSFGHSSFQGGLQILFNSSTPKPVVCITFTQQYPIKNLLSKFRPKVFQLPEEMNRFVQAIHAAEQSSVGNKATKFRLEMNNLRLDPDWCQLQVAIKKVKTSESLCLSRASSHSSGYNSCCSSHRHGSKIDLDSVSEFSLASPEKMDTCIVPYDQTHHDLDFDIESPSALRVKFDNSAKNMDDQSFVTVAKYSDFSS